MCVCAPRQVLLLLYYFTTSTTTTAGANERTMRGISSLYRLALLCSSRTNSRGFCSSAAGRKHLWRNFGLIPADYTRARRQRELPLVEFPRAERRQTRRRDSGSCCVSLSVATRQIIRLCIRIRYASRAFGTYRPLSRRDEGILSPDPSSRERSRYEPVIANRSQDFSPPLASHTTTSLGEEGGGRRDHHIVIRHSATLILAISSTSDLQSRRNHVIVPRYRALISLRKSPGLLPRD